MKCFQLSNVYRFSAGEYMHDLHMEGDTHITAAVQ